MFLITKVIRQKRKSEGVFSVTVQQYEIMYSWLLKSDRQEDSEHDTHSERMQQSRNVLYSARGKKDAVSPAHCFVGRKWDANDRLEKHSLFTG